MPRQISDLGRFESLNLAVVPATLPLVCFVLPFESIHEIIAEINKTRLSLLMTPSGGRR